MGFGCVVKLWRGTLDIPVLYAEDRLKFALRTKKTDCINILLYTDQIFKQAENAQEEAVFKCLLNIGVSVDKAELIRALSYDRDQYSKGYEDAMNSIVRCKDCKYWKDEEYCIVWDDVPVASDFCSYGERKVSN